MFKQSRTGWEDRWIFSKHDLACLSLDLKTGKILLVKMRSRNTRLPEQLDIICTCSVRPSLQRHEYPII